MIYSMTGFGRAVVETDSRKLTVDIKSLNSKQLDLFFKIPSYLREHEIGLRNRVASDLGRGKVEVVVSAENRAASTSSSINIENLASYREQISAAAARLGIAEPADWFQTLLRLPESITQSQTEADAQEIDALSRGVDEALRGINDFRRCEGEKLRLFFAEKIENISQLLLRVEPFETERVEKIRLRLKEQLEKLEGIDFESGRLEQEMIFYIEKLDVTEEKTRLRAHLNYFLETMDGEPGQGKKLGFIAQEMGREINTLGSKSNNADMQRIVVMMKDELEQIKEQVLNVL